MIDEEFEKRAADWKLSIQNTLEEIRAERLKFKSVFSHPPEINSILILLEYNIDTIRRLMKNCNKTPYGFCPTCGEPGRSRERRPDGNDRCGKGHTYPSRLAVTDARNN